MWLTIDSQEERRAAGPDDPDSAEEMLTKWRARAKVGFRQDARLRYEEIRDDYLSGGGEIQESVRRDLDLYVKNIRIGAIGDKLNAFREWRESLDRALWSTNKKRATASKSWIRSETRSMQ